MAARAASNSSRRAAFASRNMKAKSLDSRPLRTISAKVSPSAPSPYEATWTRLGSLWVRYCAVVSDTSIAAISPAFRAISMASSVSK